MAFIKAMEEATRPYENCKSYYDYLPKHFEKRRDRTLGILRRAPFDYRVFKSEGGYFTVCDITNQIPNIPTKYFFAEGQNEDKRPVGDWTKLKNPFYTPDKAFARFLSFEYNVTPLPLSPFYHNPKEIPITEWRGTQLIRFAMCKNDETLDKLETYLCRR